jgi:hypothetical protein
MSLQGGLGGEATLQWEPSRYYARGSLALDLDFAVALRAFDGLGTAYQKFTLRLTAPPNQRPSLAPLPTLTAAPGHPSYLTLRGFATDPDDANASLRFRLVLPSDTGGALVLLDGADGARIVVLAPQDAIGTRSFNVSVVVEDPWGATDVAVVQVELQGAALAPPPGDSSLLATAIALGALALAAFAFLGRRRPPPPTE